MEGWDTVDEMYSEKGRPWSHMNIEILWDNDEKTIIRWVFAGDFDWEDYKQAYMDAEKLHTEVDHGFATIFDLSQLVRVPRYPIARYPELTRQVPEKQNMLVIISTNRWVESLGRIFTSVYSTNIKFVRNSEDAYALIAKHQNSGL